MNEVNKTLYIPLYGKAAVSRKGIILHDPKAEAIWEKEGFRLKGKARSKWLCYNMGMRAAVFDGWLRERLGEDKSAVVVQIGCGMDSRVLRVGTGGHQWFDVDFPDVIAERERYYSRTDEYKMLASDARDIRWLEQTPEGGSAVVVMEGVSMYMQLEELRALLTALTGRFSKISILMDCYTVFAAKASKYKNPVNEVGVTTLYGVDSPDELTGDTGLRFVREHELTPREMINELPGWERGFFRLMFAGGVTKRIYRLYEFGER